jgi:hypothetical protein
MIAYVQSFVQACLMRNGGSFCLIPHRFTTLAGASWGFPVLRNSFMSKPSTSPQDLGHVATSILFDALGKPAPMTPKGKKNPAAAPLKPVAELKTGATGVKAGKPAKKSQSAKRRSTS